MSTNFYMTKEVEEPCKCCGRGGRNEEVHLGKRAMGWKFLFKGDRQKGITDFMSWWENILALEKDGYEIQDEYGRVQNRDEFLDMVREWGWITKDNDREGKSHAVEYASHDTWTDPVGHSFDEREFS